MDANTYYTEQHHKGLVAMDNEAYRRQQIAKALVDDYINNNDDLMDVLCHSELYDNVINAIRLAVRDHHNKTPSDNANYMVEAIYAAVERHADNESKEAVIE